MSATLTVIEFAKKEGGVFTTQEAIALGMPQSTLNRRTADGVFVRLGRGVFALPGTSTRPDVLLRAARKRLGAIVSHESAAKIHGFDPIRVRRPTVTVSHRGSYAFDGVTVHQSTDLTTDHVMTVGRHRVTSPERTLIDLAKVLGPKRLERVLDNALAGGIVDLDTLGTLFLSLTRQGKRGMKHLGRLLAERSGEELAFSESELEAMVYDLLTAAGLPPPLKQFQGPWLKRIRGRVDLAYVNEQIVIEADGRRWHLLLEAYDSDRHRDNAAMLAGWIVLRYTWKMIKDEPDVVVAQVRQALAQRS